MPTEWENIISLAREVDANMASRAETPFERAASLARSVLQFDAGLRGLHVHDVRRAPVEAGHAHANHAQPAAAPP